MALLTPKALALCLRFRYSFVNAGPPHSEWPTIDRPNKIGQIVSDHIYLCSGRRTLAEIGNNPLRYAPEEELSPKVQSLVRWTAAFQRSMFSGTGMNQRAVRDMLNATFVDVGYFPDSGRVYGAIFYPEQYTAIDDSLRIIAPSPDEILTANPWLN